MGTTQHLQWNDHFRFTVVHKIFTISGKKKIFFVKIILNQQQAKAKKYYYLDSDHLSGFTILLKIATLKCEPTYTAIVFSRKFVNILKVNFSHINFLPYTITKLCTYTLPAIIGCL